MLSYFGGNCWPGVAVADSQTMLLKVKCLKCAKVSRISKCLDCHRSSSRKALPSQVHRNNDPKHTAELLRTIFWTWLMSPPTDGTVPTEPWSQHKWVSLELHEATIQQPCASVQRRIGVVLKPRAAHTKCWFRGSCFCSLHLWELADERISCIHSNIF